MRWTIAFLFTCVFPAILNADTPPNIILFLVDDMGWQDTSLPFWSEVTPSNQRYQTPAKEKLARAGVVYVNAYSASPVCTPTRAALMTGQSPGRSGISYWTLYPNQDTSAKHPRLQPPPWKTGGLTKDDSTLPKILRREGYRTIHVGKSHLGAVGTSGADPRNLGFDVNIAGHGAGAPGSYYGIHNFKSKMRNGKSGDSVWDVPGLEPYHGQEIYLTDALTIETISALENAKNEGSPFFLQFAPYAVHTPIMKNPKHSETYAQLDAREAAYATMIESMDCALRSIMESLEDLGLLENTIVIFTSDNGGLSAHGRGGQPHVHNAPLRSGKGSAYEGGIRVPLIIAGTPLSTPGTRSDTPVISMDIFPTVLELAGIDLAESNHPPIDGISLAPHLVGNSNTNEDQLANRPLVWHMPHQWGAPGPGIEPFTSVRRGAWKLCVFHDGPRYELYNLDADVKESTNLVQENPEMVGSMLRDLNKWFLRTGAVMSRDAETGLPVDIFKNMPTTHSPQHGQ